MPEPAGSKLRSTAIVPGDAPNAMWTGSQVSLFDVELTRTKVADAAGFEALYFRTLSVRPVAMLNLRVSEDELAEQPSITPATAPFPLL